MKIKLAHLIFTGISLAVALTGQAGTTKLNTNGTWNITNSSTAGTSILSVFGGDNSSGMIKTNWFSATGECDFNGVIVGKGNGNLSNNTAIGVAVLDGASATGNEVTGIGSYALQNNTSGNANTAIGHAAMQFNTTGIANTASGIYALRNNTVGSENTASGIYSLLSNLSGTHNTAVGGWSLSDNSTGRYNTAVGYQSLRRNLGSWNTAMGLNSLVFNTTGNGNVVIGNDAANWHRDGTTQLTNTNASVYIGSGCRGMSNEDYNSIVIGAGAYGEGANTTVIGNGATVTTHLYGKTVSESLQVNGNTVLSGTVILEHAQGDINMGAYQ
jgi:hypothetical protein